MLKSKEDKFLMLMIVVLGMLLVFSCAPAYANTASYYGKKFHGRLTASGERFNMWAMTAAHKKLPFGTKVRVTNLDTNKSVTVKINDRGPFIPGRVIDLSKGAAQKIDCSLCPVQIKVLSIGDGKYKHSN